MILFPNCKINIGLDILRRREDGYHDIETFMVPVRKLSDILEITPVGSKEPLFIQSGNEPDCGPEENLCMKAFRLMQSRYGIGGVRIHLHKAIPSGAGLGGGSSDAAYTLVLLNAVCGVGLEKEQLEELAAELGSDTVFFIRNMPALVCGRGEAMQEMDNPAKGMLLLIVKPGFGVSTAQAYSGCFPSLPDVPLAERLSLPVDRWREEIVNAFEPSLFSLHPELAAIKTSLYDSGAAFASLSGSGSALYGLFDNSEEGRAAAGKAIETISLLHPQAFVHQQVL